ncbi:16S rRNA (cytidine(1402)-2'-O)-methyltransferase [Pararhizobium mangrovi]|uniref:Ribosomal RNA small subunit methyltransferase I n=1 Tax=Pararhizobium mangrovi TaxID=2590452 RepID=A0A506TZE9_9HYPH|nr:16S rRNA (cytidine(1402)-2'-O)-methyltransferase [Pararhizobium mangrovi]TPW27462.1 16S rRNA (cytidine(1402)-2'-O)-methyltransferase [Pararhizobium mangrovi]
MTFRIGTTEFPTRPLEPGLYLVATPIGNLGDITLRALETLAAAEIVACEDTRVSRVLLDRYGITARPLAYHEHNAETAGEALMTALEAGRSVALISDAGTPLVSDPGYRIANAAIDAGHRVVPIPGASAPLAALAASGLPSDGFFFDGFLPAKDKARRDRLAALAAIPGTLVFFESPHRIAASLTAARDVLGAKRAGVVARELTKAYEEIRRGTLEALAADFTARERVRGEIVLLVGPGEEAPPESDEEIETLLATLLADRPPAKAAREAARLTGLDRKALYQRLLAMKERSG